MTIEQPLIDGATAGGSVFPFPLEWIKDSPQKVESILANTPANVQANWFLALSGRAKQDLLYLSPHPKDVVQLLPPDEVYLAIKEIGEEDALFLLGLAGPEKVQYMLDIELWQEDKFIPAKALDWLDLLGQSNDSHNFEWFVSEEFETKVMVLQSLIKVYKNDEMTDQYENVESLPHFTPDSTYDIYFKVADAQPVLKKLFLRLYSEEQAVFYSLMEAVIWYPVTPTLEKSYQWRNTRIAECGLVDFDEAIGVYSLLKPEALRLAPPAIEDFPEGDTQVAPVSPWTGLDANSFLGECFSLLKDPKRVDSLCWELMYLSNKVMVADKQDFASLEIRRQIFYKVLGYINIGLQLGAMNDPVRGAKLLQDSWMENLFQVGYACLMRLKWEAEKLVREEGLLMREVLDDFRMDHLTQLIGRFPKIGVMSIDEDDKPAERPEINWRDLSSLSDVQLLENFIFRLKFYLRFAKQVLGLTGNEIIALKSDSGVTDEKKLNIHTLTVTALAQYALFGKVLCRPLPEVAAKSFLQIVFLPNIYNDEENKVLNQDIIDSFNDKILESPLAWTDEDREHFKEFLSECQTQLTEQCGRIRLDQPIEWNYVHILWVSR